MSEILSFDEAKMEILSVMAEIRQEITKPPEDESRKFLRVIDHELDADLMAGKFLTSMSLDLPKAVRVTRALECSDLTGIYDLQSSDVRTYQSGKGFVFFFDANEGYWKIANVTGEIVARCADSIHFVPDKLGGLARPFEVAQKLRHGLAWVFDFTIHVDKVSF